MKTKHLLIGLLAVIVLSLIVGGTVAVRGVYAFIHPVPLNIRNSTSLPPTAKGLFNAGMWGYPVPVSSVYVYWSKQLRADAFLRFRINDPQSYVCFKTNLLSSADFSQTSPPLVSKRDDAHITDWWDLAPAVSLYKTGYWFFGFDDTNHIVYVLRQGD